MEDFELVEADFQQYYQLDVSQLGFRRYGRLFSNLPPYSRIMKKLSPAGSWSWRDETLSRMLHELSAINAMLYNTNRKKGAKPAKPEQQFQPEYVETAKKEYQEWQKEQKKNAEDKAAMDAFWKARNPDAKFL